MNKSPVYPGFFSLIFSYIYTLNNFNKQIMKKIYISICALVISASTIAQVSSLKIHPLEYSKDLNQDDIVVSNQVTSLNNASSNTMQNVIWESDFSDPSDWLLDNAIGGGGAFGWTIDAINDGWWSQNGISSSSGGNYAELSNGDATSGTQLLNVTYTMTSSQPIDIAGLLGNNYAYLSFEEFGARFNDLQEVQISTDGVSFTTIADNLNYSVLSQSGGSAYANPTLREINLSSYLNVPGANPSTVWIRYSWTTNYPQSATNPNVWIAYGWYIDDVKIYGAPANNITMYDEVIGGWWVEYLNAGGLGQDYTLLPLDQAQNNPYAFESVVINDGSAPQDVTMYVDVLDAASNIVFSTNSLSQSLSPSSRDTFICSSFFTPTLTGFYEVRMWSVADSAGAGTVMTYSDTAVKMCGVTDYEYGKDLNSPNGDWRLSRNSGGFEVSATYDIYSDVDLYSVKAYITDWSVPGALVYAVIYEEDISGGDPIPLDQTDDYTIQAGDRDNWINLNFLSPTNLLSGTTYRVAIGGYVHPSDTAGINMSGSGTYSSDGLQDKDDFYGDGQGTWYTISDIPMLRMNFDPASVISAVSNAKQTIFNVYPNPTNGEFVIALDATAKYDITIINVLGQTVISTTTSGMNTSIDLSKFGKGIYTVELKSNSSTYIERIIVE